MDDSRASFFGVGIDPAAEDVGHFRPHRDNGQGLTAHRRFAVSINLTGDFEGGAVGFPETLTGGAGNDTFAFAAGDSGITASTSDLITGFDTGDSIQVQIVGGAVRAENRAAAGRSFDQPRELASEAFANGQANATFITGAPASDGSTAASGARAVRSAAVPAPPPMPGPAWAVVRISRSSAITGESEIDRIQAPVQPEHCLRVRFGTRL